MRCFPFLRSETRGLPARLPLLLRLSCIGPLNTLSTLTCATRWPSQLQEPRWSVEAPHLSALCSLQSYLD
jgi:hypothetical protein